MSRKYAYRADGELTKALRELSAETQQFYGDTIKLWNEAHSDVSPVWRRHAGGELECLGFELNEGCTEIPLGLSASQKREWLIPRPGRAGNQWRADLELLNKRPQLGSVLATYGIEPIILRTDSGRYCHIGLHDTLEGYFLTWGAEHPLNPHLTPVPLSVYYAALERANTDGVS